MPYSIRLQACIEKTDEDGNGESFVDLSRYYDGQDLDRLPQIMSHFARLATLSVANADLAKIGAAIGLDEENMS